MLETELIHRTNQAIEEAESHGFHSTAQALREVLRSLNDPEVQPADDTMEMEKRAVG